MLRYYRKYGKPKAVKSVFLGLNTTSTIYGDLGKSLNLAKLVSSFVK